MAVIAIYPLGVSTPRKDGTALGLAPPGQHMTSNYKVDRYPQAIDGLTDAELDANYSGRWDDPRYYAGDSPS